MGNHESNYLSDEEIIKRAHEEQGKAAVLGEERFGVLADAIDVLRYRVCEWWEQRCEIRPVHKMNHLYRGSPSLARELAVQSCLKSALTNIMHVAALLRSGLIGLIPSCFRVAQELWVDAVFLRLDTSGHSAVRMLDWQLSDTAKVSPENLDLQAEYKRMKKEYKNDKNYGKPGACAELPNGKKYHNIEARTEYVYRKMAKEVPEQVLSTTDWPLIKEVSRNQRAQANATVHSSPIARALVDDQFSMALQAALLLPLTVTAYGRVSDEWIDQNHKSLVLEMTEALIEDELAWMRLGIALDKFSLAVQYTVAINGMKSGASQDSA